MASILLSSTIKHKGSVALQVYGRGIIKLGYAECNSNFNFKSTLKLKTNPKKIENLSFKNMINGSKEGIFSVLIDQKIKNQKPYQGIIPIEGDNVSEMIGNYLKNSEQIDSELILSSNSKTATGLLIQKMPSKKNETDMEWLRLSKITSQIFPDILNQDNTLTIIDKLFGSLQYKVLKIKTPIFSCHCSPDRAKKILKILGGEDTKKLVSPEVKIEVKCDFCNRQFSFDQDEYSNLFI